MVEPQAPTAPNLRPRSSPLPVALAVAVLAASLAALSLVDGPVAVFLPVAGLAFLFAALRVFAQPLRVLAVYLLVIVNLDFVKLGSTGVSADILTSALLLSLLAVWAVRSWGLTVSAAPRIEAWFLVYIAAAAVSVVLSPMAGLSAKRFGREIEYLLLVWLLLRYPATRGDIRAVVLAMLLSSVAPCLLGVVGYVFRIQALLSQELYLETVYEGEARVKSLLSHAGTLAMYLMVMLSLTASLFLSGRLFPRRLTGPLLALQGLTLYLTYGRSGWLGVFAAAVTLLALRRQHKLLLLGVPGVAAAAWKVVPNLQARLSTVAGAGSENSLLWRFGLWTFALERFPERPVFGSGVGTFLPYINYLHGFNAHQTWIGLLIETGVVGVAAFLGLMVVTARTLWRVHAACDGDAKPLVQAAIAAWVGAMCGSLTVDAFGLPAMTIYLWVLIGLALNSTRSGVLEPGEARAAVPPLPGTPS